MDINFQSTIMGIISLGVVVTIHEFGHYLFARIAGIGVEVFSIGMGTTLVKIMDARGTIWQICAIPIGGYIIPKDESVLESAVDLKDCKEKRSVLGLEYKKAGPLRGIFVASAGPLFNFITAFFCFIALNYISGFPRPSFEIIKVSQNSLANKAGLAPGDKIITINEVEVKTTKDLAQPNLRIKARRGNNIISFYIEKNRNQLIGVVFGHEFIKMSFWEACVFSLKEVFYQISRILMGFWSAIVGLNFMGPIGIIKDAGKAHEQGLVYVILFIANVSIAIGAFNLIPIPILDGGRIIMFFISWAIGRPVPEKIESFLNYFSVSLLIGLFLLGSFLDIKGFI
jgi:regulator of sigma E protease